MDKFQRQIEAVLRTEDKQLSRQLYSAYQQSIDEITAEVKAIMDKNEELRFPEKLKLARLQSLRSQINDQMKHIKSSQHKTIYDYLNSLGHIGYNELFYEFEMSQQFPLSFTMLSDKAILAIVNTPVANLKLSTRLNDGVVRKLRKNILSALRRGFNNGDSYEKIARDLANAGESSYKRALNIARTEGGRISGVTHQMSQEDAKKAGARVEKEWDATLDLSTRDSHARLDGTRIGVDEYFKANGHKALQPHLFGVASEDCNCRCRSRGVIKGYEPELRLINERREIKDGDKVVREKKKVAKYQTYKQWVSDKTSDINNYNPLSETNMLKAVGENNYNLFVDSLNTLSDARLKNLFNVFGDKFEFENISKAKDYVSGTKLQLSEAAFNGKNNKNPLQSVYHEFGHAIDNLSADVLDSDFDRASEIPSYKLKKAIKDDLLRAFNKDLKEINGDSCEAFKNLNKLSVYDQGAIIRKYKSLAKDNPAAYSILSDMMESTGSFVEYPLGSGHGLKYWKRSGMQEAEFFAHMTEIAANDEARKMMYEMFPSAVKKWEMMIDEILMKGRMLWQKSL